MLKLTALISILAISTIAIAQKSTLYRPRIAEFSREVIHEAGLSSNSEEYGNATTEVDNDILWKIKFGIPIIIKDKRMIGLQLKYYQHNFQLDHEQQSQDYQFYNHLNLKKVTSTGARFLYEEKLSRGRKLNFIGGFEIKSDELVLNKNTTQYYFSSNYVFKKTEDLKLGVGFVIAQTLGVFTPSPFFMYERSLTPKWILNLTLPKSISIRHELNTKSFVTTKLNVRGWRYNLTNAVDSELRNLTLRKADIQFTLKYEREIHDWLWFGLTFGYNRNVRYYLVEPGGRRRDNLIKLRTGSSPYSKIAIFLVPPKKFYD